MTDGQRPGIVVVGASLAGLRGAEALRDGGYDGPLTLVGDEPHRPYDRPPLSKHVLAGERRRVGIDERHRQAEIAAAGGGLAADQAGADDEDAARPQRQRAPQGAGILQGPDREDPGEIGAFSGPWPRPGAGGDQERLVGKRRAVGEAHHPAVPVQGDGRQAEPPLRAQTGELRKCGRVGVKLARLLGTVIGATLAGRMRASGVDLRPNVKVVAFSGEDGQVRRAHLAGGADIATDLVIVALGATRDTGWLAAAALVADPGGLTCDAACRALTTTGEPDPAIYAAGDVARWPNPLTGGRLVTVEHWGNAVDQARHAAANMLAPPTGQVEYQHVPSFWSSQFGLNIKLAGLTEGAEALAIVQGSRASHRFLAVYGRAGRTVAALSFDQARWLPAYAEAVADGAAFPPILGATDQPRIETLEPGFPSPRRSSGRSVTALETAHA